MVLRIKKTVLDGYDVFRGITLNEEENEEEEQENPLDHGLTEYIPNYKKLYLEAQEKIKELEVGLANALAVNESHQKLNGKLQQRVTELEEDNKKLAHEIEDRVHKMRKSGL